MPKFFMGGIVFFLLLAAGYSIATIQARSIPWDCTDWQAFAHEDRTTAILESLAENRGKTLYCGIDQSDTFAKAETWEAGKDRNERDDTVYYGERGQFRGFIAAQEGYLTDGESGVTGVSIDRIFEFPREERRRTKRTKRLDIMSEGNCPDKHPTDASEYTPGTLACSPWAGPPSGGSGQANRARREARYFQINSMDGITRDSTQAWTVAWATFPTAEYWQDLAETQAQNACRAQGYPAVTNVVFTAGHDNNRGDLGTGGHVIDRQRGANLGWFISGDQSGGGLQYAARQSRTWTATCKKVIRRTRK